MRPYNIAGLALGASVTCSAPASRPLVPSSNKSIQVSEPSRIQLPIVLDFHSKAGKKTIAKWYRQQPITHFARVEYRKQAGGLFRHEFVVVHLGDSTLCRFDRRAREDLRGHALKDEGTISEDSAHVVAPEDADHKAYLDCSEILLSIDLPQELDLKFILAVCYGIQFHPKAKSYSLFYYNCYFFSWTLITAIARRASGWEETMGSKALRKKMARIIALEYSKTMWPEINRPIARSRPTPRKSSIIRRIWGVVSSPEATHKSVGTDTVHDYQKSLSVDMTLESGLDDKKREGARKLIPKQKSLHTRIKQELEIVPGLLLDGLETLLLKSQLSKLNSLIKGEINSALWKASGIVAGQCAVDAALQYYVYDTTDIDHGSEAGYFHDLADFIEKVATSTASRANRRTINSLRTREINHAAATSHNKELNAWHKSMDLGEDEWENSWDNVWAEEIGDRYRKGIMIYSPLDSSPSAGKKAWRRAWEILKDRPTDEMIALKIGENLLEHLVDPPFKVAQLASEAGESAESRYSDSYFHEGRSVASNNQESASLTLQGYIRTRMVAHFEQVESYGFGRAGELIDKAEDSMCDIWATAVRMMRIVALD